MYCPVCGAESTQGLNYCKRCGSNLAPPTNPIRSTERRPRVRATAGAAWAIALATVAVALGGLGIVFSSAFELVHPLAPGTTAVSGAATVAGLMVAFGSLTVLFTIALLIRLFSKLLGLGQEAQDSPDFRKQQTTGEHKAAAQLPAPPSAISSVTEQTTRNFDPALYKDRES